MSPRAILKNAEQKGLNAFAVTDHNTITGGINALKISKEMRSNVIVIVGAEILTNIGDVVGLFLNDEIKSRDIFEVIDEIHRQGGLVVLPHPFRGHIFGDLKTVTNRLDMLEVFNSRSPIRTDQIQFLKSSKKTLLGSSDAHFPQEIGLCQSTLSSEDLSTEEIRQMLLNPDNVTPYGSFGSHFFQIFSQIVKFIKSTAIIS